MTGFGFSIGGIYMTLLLLAGSFLTFITIRRMLSGQISLPAWAKWLLIACMILMLIITLLSMLPPVEVNVDTPFVDEYTHIITSADPTETASPN